MRELILKVWCDICAMERGEDGLQLPMHMEASHTYTIGVVAGEARPALKLLEVCDTHNKVATELIDLLAQVGQTPDMPTVKPAARQAQPLSEAQGAAKRLVPCPACRLEVQRNTMVSHVWRHHRKDSRPDLHLTCPTCREKSANPAGLAAHRRQIHDFDALADALSGVDVERYPALAVYRRNGVKL